LENAPDVSFKEIGSLFIANFQRETTPETTPEESKEKSEPIPIAEQILAQLSKSPKLTAAELAQRTGLTVDGVKYHLKNLKQHDRLQRHGPNKGGYWQVIDG